MCADFDTDFDARLRGALRAEAEAVGDRGFEDTGGSARSAVVAGVRRRHQRRIAVVGGLTAAVAAVAIVLSVALPSSTGGHTPSLSALSPRAAAGSPSGSNAHAAAGSGGAQSATAACPQASVGSGQPACAGSFSSTSGAVPSASAAPGYAGDAQGSDKANAPFAPAASNPIEQAPATPSGSVSLRVGQRLTVHLPASTPVARWDEPTVTTGAALLVETGRATSTGGSWTVTYKASRSGSATVTARGTCERSATTSPSYQSICEGGTTQWHLSVVVTR